MSLFCEKHVSKKIQYTTEHNQKIRQMEQSLLQNSMETRIKLTDLFRQCCQILSIEENSIKEMNWWLVSPYGFVIAPPEIRARILETFVTGDSIMNKLKTAKNYRPDNVMTIPPAKRICCELEIDDDITDDDI